MIWLSAPVLAQTFASTSSAPATPPPTQPAPAVVVTHEWYGYQTLVVDGAGLSLVTIGVAQAFRSNGSAAVFLTGLVGGGAVYALGAPIVHVVHGRIVIGLADLGIRTASGFLGTAIAASIIALGFGGTVDTTEADVAVGIFATGLLVPMVIDAAVLSSATVVHYSDRPSTISSSWSLAPLVTVAPVVSEGGKRIAAPVFGMGGTF